MTAISKLIRQFKKITPKQFPNLQASFKSFKLPSISIKQYSKLNHSHQNSYKPTIYLNHPLAQSIYNITQPQIKLNYSRQKIFFDDGGHISLDWASPIKKVGGQQFQYQPNVQAPIFFVMHGLTGGSQMNYVKVLIEQARRKGFRSVCFNSRGICNQMTSPWPFTGIDFQQLETSLDTIQNRYPNAPLYLVGASFGSNFLTRYLIKSKNKRKNIKGYVGLATPFNINTVVSDMGSVYQKFFVKRYIEETVKKHPQMKYWQDIGLVNYQEVLNAKNLSQFHSRITIKIVNFNHVDQLFKTYNIGKQIQMLKIPSLYINSLDDPIVSSRGIPYQSIRMNKNIKFIETKQGGHVCWYQGNLPKRWYPKPTLEFIQSLIQDQKHKNQTK